MNTWLHQLETELHGCTCVEEACDCDVQGCEQAVLISVSPCPLHDTEES